MTRLGSSSPSGNVDERVIHYALPGGTNNIERSDALPPQQSAVCADGPHLLPHA